VIDLDKKETIVLIAYHLGGDVRGNYTEPEIYLVSHEFEEVDPWCDLYGGVKIVVEFDIDGKRIVAVADDHVEPPLWAADEKDQKIIDQLLTDEKFRFELGFQFPFDFEFDFETGEVQEIKHEEVKS